MKSGLRLTVLQRDRKSYKGRPTAVQAHRHDTEGGDKDATLVGPRLGEEACLRACVFTNYGVKVRILRTVCITLFCFELFTFSSRAAAAVWV